MDILADDTGISKNKVIVYLLLLVMAVIYLGPFLWTVSASLKPRQEIFDWPIQLIPDQPTIQNYIKVFTTVPYARWLFNTGVITVTATIGNLLLASLAGYAFARIEFPGREIIFLMFLGTIMIPRSITLIPVFSMMKSLGWVNTYQGVILPQITNVFGIFLMRQFFQNIPRELEDAARIDGLGRFGTWWKIIMPLAKPALGALTIFSFKGVWNQFMWPLIMMSTEDMFTLTVGMNAFKGQYETMWNLVMAGTVLMAIPVIVVFIMFQNYFIKGVQFSGIKG